MKDEDTIKNAVGEYCLVINTDGSTEVKRLNTSPVFDKAREFIGCKWLEPVYIHSYIPGKLTLAYLVNEDGYAEWKQDPKKVNQIATFIYSSGEKPSHYILGNAVMCFLLDDDDGGKFVGFSDAFANNMKSCIDSKMAKDAKDTVPIPDVVPDPIVKISTFDNDEEFFKAIGIDPAEIKKHRENP